MAWVLYNSLEIQFLAESSCSSPGLAQGQQSCHSPLTLSCLLDAWCFSFPSLARPDNSCSRDKGTWVASYVYKYKRHHLAFCDCEWMKYCTSSTSKRENSFMQQFLLSMWMNGLFIHPACSHIAGAFWGLWRLPCMVACTALKIPATIGRCLLDNATGTFNHLYWLSTTGLAEQTGSIQTTLHTNLPWGMYVLMYNEPLMMGYPQQLHTW